MEIINKEPLQFKRSDFKASWTHYLLTIPPIAQWFLCWYIWQVMKIYMILGYKNFVKSVYTQKAIITGKDATNLNTSVDNYHNKQMKPLIIKAKRFEKVALVSLLLTGLCWTTLSQDNGFNSSTLMIGTMAQRTPSAINETAKDFFGKRQ